jgi:hypothetical protein
MKIATHRRVRSGDKEPAKKTKGDGPCLREGSRRRSPEEQTPLNDWASVISDLYTANTERMNPSTTFSRSTPRSSCHSDCFHKSSKRTLPTVASCFPKNTSPLLGLTPAMFLRTYRAPSTGRGTPSVARLRVVGTPESSRTLRVLLNSIVPRKCNYAKAGTWAPCLRNTSPLLCLDADARPHPQL